MMCSRFIVIVIWGTMCLTAVAAWADAQSDARVIAREITTDDRVARIRELVAESNADAIADLLALRSVEVKDRPELIRLVVEYVPAVTIEEIQAEAFEWAMIGFQPELRAEIAEFLRRWPLDEPRPYQEESQQLFERAAGSPDETEARKLRSRANQVLRNSTQNQADSKFGPYLGYFMLGLLM